MNQQQKDKAGLEAYLEAGGKIRPMPDGPTLECFRAQELAQAIEYEVQKPGTTKIRLDMTREDAQALATYLRRAVLSGL